LLQRTALSAKPIFLSSPILGMEVTIKLKTLTIQEGIGPYDTKLYSSSPGGFAPGDESKPIIFRNLKIIGLDIKKIGQD
jgi:hypothetical protein